MGQVGSTFDILCPTTDLYRLQRRETLQELYDEGYEDGFPSLYAAFEFMDPERTKLISDPARFEAVTSMICEDHKTHKWNEIDVDGNGCVSFPEFVEWARIHRVNLPLGIIEGVDSTDDCPAPAEWSGPTSGPACRRWNKLRPVSSEVFIEIQQMIDATHRAVWTRDRKKTGDNRIPRRYELVNALRNENHKDWVGYWLKRLQVLKHQREDPRAFHTVQAKTGASSLSGRHFLIQACNEWLLFHGTNEKAAQGIASGDFTMRLAGTATGTLYGRGTYFADSFTKADEYAQKARDGTCCALICRAVGGAVLYNDEVTPDAQALTDAVTRGQFDSILGDREKCRGTFKEYVLFDADQVYVEYVIYYRRIYE
jgi:hypothetical protein